MPHADLPSAVADALERSDAEALLALAEGADRALRKAAKRALHLLRSKGVEIPEPVLDRNAATAEAQPPPEAEREPLRLTAFDGAGERAFFVPLKALHGYTLYVGIVSDAHALLELATQDLSRRQLKSYFAALPAETRDVLREVALGEGADLLRPSLAQAQGPLGPLARTLLAALPEPQPPQERDGDAAQAPGALAETIELFRTPVFASYVPDRASIDKLSQSLSAVVQSPLYVDETQRLAQLRRVVEQATVAFFDVDRRRRYALRAAEAAEVFRFQGADLDAGRALALAEALRGEREVLEIPFARGFFERLLNLEAALKPAPPAAAPPPVAPALIVPGR